MECILEVFVLLISSFILGCSALYFLLPKSKYSKVVEEVLDPVTGKKKVRIYDGDFERGIHDILYMFGQAHLTNVAFIESPVPLQKADIVKALAALAKMHPLLRSKCEWEQDKRRYLTEMSQFSSKDLLYSEEQLNISQDWVGRFEEELEKGFDVAKGPLWRIVRISESFNPDTEKHNSTLLLTFHHAICDQMSVLALLDQLLEILDQIHSNTFNEEGVVSLPRLPPLMELVKHHTHLNLWEKIVLKVNATLQVLKGIQCNFLDCYPPPLVQNPSMIAKTCIVPGSLTEKQTSLLIKNCKTHKCTVTGALGTCIAVASRKMLEGFNESAMKVDIGFPVNVRKNCRPVVNSNEFGLYIGLIIFSVTQDKSLTPSQYFWYEAQHISSVIKEKMQNQKGLFGFSILIENGIVDSAQIFIDAKKSTKYAGRFPNIELTNCGNFLNNQQRVHTLKEVRFAVAQDIMGPLLTVSSMSVNRQLYWNVVYCNAAVSPENAETFAHLLHESILEFGCEDDVE